MHSVPETKVVDGQTYKLSFHDEFDGAALDMTKWRHRILGPPGGGSHPLFFTKDASFLDREGNLVMLLYTRPRADLSPDVAAQFKWKKWIPFTSMLRTKKEFTYGYHEVRVKMPIVKGAGMAVWMQSRGQTSRTPSPDPKVGAEIDLLEQTFFDKYGKPTDFKHSTIHWGGYGDTHQWVSITVRPLSQKPQNWDEELNLRNQENTVGGLVHEKMSHYSDDLDFRDGEFHTVGVLWTREFYKFYYDHELIGTIRKGVSESPAYMILWPRLYNYARLVDNTADGMGDREQTKARFVVDYYRVYMPATD
jgi:beta-glucanase (GH16 family)